MANVKTGGGIVKTSLPLANQQGTRDIPNSVENLFNLAMVERVFEDASIPDSKLVSGGGGSVNYKEYVAQITQTGTNAPVANIIVNTLPETPTWAYGGVGFYQLFSAGNIFTPEKTVCFLSPEGAALHKYQYFQIDAGELNIYTSDISGGSNTPTNGQLFNQGIMIRVYD